MRPKSPCKDCNDRHETCHTVCDRYSVWKAEWEEQRKTINNSKYYYAEMYRLRNESIGRMRRKNHA